MANWAEFRAHAPELADGVSARLLAHKHHVLATLRVDGTPRVSGTEVEFMGDRLILGSMLGAVKARDLRDRGAYALHSNPGHHTMDGGDAKLSGTATELTGMAKAEIVAANPQPNDEDYHVFELDIGEAVWTTVGETTLTIRRWTPDRGLQVFERA